MKTTKLQCGLVILSLLFGLEAAVRAAEVATDELDYAPGATAYITGSGFAAGETVMVQVLHADGTPATGEDHEPWSVVADAEGAFATTWHVCEDDCLGSTLHLTATGQGSSLSAETYFTDAVFSILLVPPGIVSASPGGCARTVFVPGSPRKFFVRPGFAYRFNFSITTNGVPPPCLATTPSSINLSLGPNFGNLVLTVVRQGSTLAYTNTIFIPADVCGETAVTYTCDDGSVRETTVGAGSWRLVASADCTNTIACSCQGQSPPTIACPTSVQVGTEPGQCYALKSRVNLGTPTVTDDCPVIYLSNDAPAQFPVGDTTVIWTATDSDGNTTTCSQIVTVIDSEPPSLLCPTMFFSDNFESGIPNGTSISGSARIASDGSGNQVLHLTDDGQCCTNGYFYIPDPAGGATVRNLTARWRSRIGGTTQLGELQQFGQGGADGYSLSWGTDVASSGFQGEEGTGTGLIISIDTFDNGTTETAPSIEIRYAGNSVAFDPIDAGNPAAAKAFLRKNQFVDAELTVDDSGQVTFTYDGRTLSGLLPGWVGIAGGNFVFGARTGAAQDNHWIDDLDIDITFVASGACSASVNFAASTADNCGVASLVYKIGETSITSPHVFPAGTTTVDVTATDIHDNVTTCSFTVTVTGSGGGGGGPLVLTCPPDLNVQCDGDVPLPDPSSVSVSGENPVVTHVGDEVSGHCPKIVLRTYQATDACGGSGTCTQTITVQDTIAPTITGCPAGVDVGTDPGLCSAVVSYSPVAEDNCDGSVPVVCSPPSGYAFPKGTTPVTCTSTDDCGNTSTCAFNVTVRDLENPVIACPAAIEQLTDSGRCDAVVNFVASATDNCPGGTLLCAPESGAVFPLGQTTVVCTATDDAGNSAQCSFTVTIENPAPDAAITSPASGAVFPVNTPITFTGTFTDNAGDIHTATWSFDGVEVAGTVNEATGEVTALVSFATPGVYQVTLTVTDVCGNSVTVTTVNSDPAMVIIYDPNGGFVTGGGWISSPAGAYAPNLSLAGKANFGFVSKYHNGATVPSGETEFQFKLADLNFHSTEYYWLVVAGARAQYKGAGTINGAGGYSFLLTATDGQVAGGGGIDKFRIKIWNDVGVVYDNVMGASEDPNSANPQAISGGSIVIHK